MVKIFQRIESCQFTLILFGRGFVEACASRIPDALSSGAQSSRQVQCPAVPVESRANDLPESIRLLSGTLGRFSAAITDDDARLASGRWLALTGWDWLPTGLQREVSNFDTPSPSPRLRWRDRDSQRVMAQDPRWSITKLEVRIDETYKQAGEGQLSPQDCENFFRYLGSVRGLSEAGIGYLRLADEINWRQWQEARF